MDAVVLRLEQPPLGEIEVAEAEVLEDQPPRIERRQLLDGCPAPLAGGLDGREQLGNGLAVLRPDDRGRLAGSRRPRRQRPDREVGRVWCEPARRFAFTSELRGQLTRRDLGDREVIDHLAGRPLLLGGPPVGLALREAGHFTKHIGARGLEIVPQGLDRSRKCHGREYTPMLGFLP